MLFLCFIPLLLQMLQVTADEYCSPYKPPPGPAPTCITGKPSDHNPYIPVLGDGSYQSSLADDEECPKVHFIAVRGTRQDPGPGNQSCLINQIMDRFTGADACGLVYPAGGLVLHAPWVKLKEYKESEQEGVNNLTAHLKSYTGECPNTKIVLMGYSQGAHIVGDVLCGRTAPSSFKWPQPAIDRSYTANIVAILQMGDPNNNLHPKPVPLPWHAGNSTTGGWFPKKSIKDCLYLDGKWRSYCDKGDPFCARGVNGRAHLEYPSKYNDEIVDFILGKLPGMESQAHDDSFEL